MGGTEKRTIRVFIASPGDLVEERRAFRDAITQLNLGFGDGANVEFVPLGWEDVLASTGRRSQGVINREIDTCDVFILAMHRRWGQEAPDAKPYSSYTEEEFHRALERWKKCGTPEIFVFFKRVDAESEADPGVQLRKVIDFRKHLEQTKLVLYHSFDSVESFLNEVDCHLRAYAKGELPKACEQMDTVVLPLKALEEVEKAKQVALEKTEEARVAHNAAEEARSKLEAMQLQIAEDAAKLSKEGKVEHAREKFAQLVTVTGNARILMLGFEFFSRTGDLDSARFVMQRWIGMYGSESKSKETAAAYGNLGILYRQRGELDKAEEMYQQCLAIEKSQDNKWGMAIVFGNLGKLYHMRGDYKLAEQMHQSSISLSKEVGNIECMASQFANLGVLYQFLGNLGRAEKMYCKALEIEQLLDRKEGVAICCNRLGSLNIVKGNLDAAEELHLKELAINKALGMKRRIASAYNNLGLVYQKRRLFDQAERMYKEAIAICEKVSDKECLANAYGNLGVVFLNLNELDRSEEMQRKSLSVCEEMGSLAGVANAFGNLGIVFQVRGNCEQARLMHLKALSIHESLGHKENIANDLANLGRLHIINGETIQAKEMLQKALELFRECQSPNAGLVARQLNELGD
ncbi:tetratricopeptide repeat protein [Aeoliella mucimassa]|uniref:Photosystem I assembly protein Ycf3 n=1 Tax=Aeoliella mucimassa TaxID=2527972 RepID=A0A518AHI1_9BACT|nr:tetratricopeptide repeat protein [Aeoliella mucimassa]QDU54188.1 photosystem I assembly protein Ycf3 [Aeoliella mucimassa]